MEKRMFYDFFLSVSHFEEDDTDFDSVRPPLSLSFLSVHIICHLSIYLKKKRAIY